MMPRLTILETNRILRIARGGRLQPWLGPALRGLAGGRLRARTCRQPVAEQLGRWQHCTGCPVMAGCAYGETVEPDPPPDVRLAAGWENAARPLVCAADYPAPLLANPGDRLGLCIKFIGPAIAHADQLWDALRTGGADPMLGLGEDQVLFDVLPPDGAIPAERHDLVELPLDLSGGAMVPAVRVELTSPLVLMAEKRLVTEPTFSDLVRAALRVLGPLFRCWGEPLPEPIFAAVKSLAEGVPTLDPQFRVVAQPKSSHRSGDRWPVRGVVGEATYGPVPAMLLPWLDWAGRVHVGTHRVAGAGGWRVVNED